MADLYICVNPGGPFEPGDLIDALPDKMQREVSNYGRWKILSAPGIEPVMLAGFMLKGEGRIRAWSINYKKLHEPVTLDQIVANAVKKPTIKDIP